jgi:hypothetical protein
MNSLNRHANVKKIIAEIIIQIVFELTKSKGIPLKLKIVLRLFSDCCYPDFTAILTSPKEM